MGSVQHVDNNFKLYNSGDKFNDIQITKNAEGTPVLVSEDIQGAADCRAEAREHYGRLTVEQAKGLLTEGQTLIVRADGEMAIREVRAKQVKRSVPKMDAVETGIFATASGILGAVLIYGLSTLSIVSGVALMPEGSMPGQVPEA